MTAKLRVVTWNAEGMFVENTKTRRATPHDGLGVLRRLNADIVVIPEFGVIEALHDEVELTLRALGYEVSIMPYDDARAPGLGMAILSRLPLHAQRVHSLGDGGRNFCEVLCRDSNGAPIRVFGVHLDDRAESIRLTQLPAIVDEVNKHLDERVLVLGDFNAMHEKAWFARFARSSAAQVGTVVLRDKLMVSMAERVREMAIGTTVKYILEHTNLHDLDTHRKRTISAKQAGLEWAPSVRLAKIDWIFGSKHFTTHKYTVLGDVGSDHRPVIAELTYI